MSEQQTGDSDMSSNASQAHTKPLTKKQKAFLAAYSDIGTITHAARHAGINPCMHSVWMKEHPGYPRAFKEADDAATETLINVARKRAVEGTRSYKFHNGQPIYIPCPHDHPEALTLENRDGYWRHYYESSYSVTENIFLIKGKREEYKDNRFYTEVAGKGGGPIKQQTSNIDLSKLSVELRKAIVKELGLDKEEEEMS